MKFLKATIVFIVTASLLASCKGDKAESAAKFIPSSASTVISMDMGKLAENDLTISKIASWYQFNSLKENVEKSGIDTTARLFSFVSLTEGGLANTMVGFLFSLADEDLFKSYMAEYGEVAEENGITFLEDKFHFVATNGTHGLILTGFTSFDYKTEGMAILTAKPENTIIADEKNMFALQQEKAYDFAIWTDGYELSKIKEMGGNAGVAMSSLHLNEFYTSSVLTFDKGEVVLESEISGSDAFNETYKNFLKGNGVAEATSSMINGEDLVAYFGLKFDPEGFEEVAAINEFKSQIDNALSQMQIELKDVLEAFSGDIAVSLNGTVEVEQEKVNHFAYLYEDDAEKKLQKEIMPDFTLAVGIADKEKFDKLMNLALLVFDGELEKLDEGYYFHKSKGVGMIEKQGNLIVAFGPTITKLKEGKVNEPSGEVIGDLSSYPTYYYFNMNDFFEVASETPGMSMVSYAKPYVPFTEIIGYATSDNNLSSKMVVKMKDPEVNSLKQIVAVMDELYSGLGGKILNGMM